MQWPDLVNGAFELLGGLFVAINVRRLLRDKKIAGVSVAPTAFFASWGLWNLYYYPSLGQWISFAGGIAVVAGNLAWVTLAILYGRRNRV